MQTIGNYLKSGREARNIKLSDVAHSTKISKWYLDCLEKDEFDKIPGGPYIKGYITSYASYIGIEEDEILKRYESLQINDDEETENQDQLPQHKKRQAMLVFSSGKKKLILGMAALILVAFGFGHFYFNDQIDVGTNPTIAQHTESAPPLTSKTKQSASRIRPHKNAITPEKSDVKALKETNTFKQEPVIEPKPHKSVLAHANQADKAANTSESHPEYQPLPGLETLALFPSEQKSKGASQEVFSEKKTVHYQKPAPKEPVARESLPTSKKIGTKQVSPKTPESTKQQNSLQIADLNSGSVAQYRTPDTNTQAKNNLRVIKAVATNGVKDRTPAEPGNSFHWTTKRVYIWSMIECKNPPSSIRHTYYFKGQKVNDIELQIKSPQWRTWSYKTLSNKRYIGQWKVDITSIEGELLQTIFFDVN